MANKFLAIADFFDKNWLSLTILCGVAFITFILVILVSWLIGYWCNALYNTKFDLNACGSIINVSIAGLGSLITTAGAGWAKFHTNSKYNTELGSTKERENG